MTFIAIVCCLCIRFYYHSLLFLDNTLDMCVHCIQRKIEYNVTHEKKWEHIYIVMCDVRGAALCLSLVLVSTHSNWHDNCFQIDSFIWMCINRFHTWHQFLFHSRQQQKRKDTKEYKHSATHTHIRVCNHSYCIWFYCSVRRLKQTHQSIVTRFFYCA